MNRILVVLLVVSITIVDCKKAKDESNSLEALLARFLLRSLLNSAINPELPSNLSVAVPRSIRKPTDPVSGSFRNFSAKSQMTPGPGARGIAQDTFDYGFTGQAFLLYGTYLVSEVLQASKLDLILISGAYTKAKANPGVCIPGGDSIVRITQEMENEFVDGMERLGLTELEARDEVLRLQLDGTLPSVGQAVPSPAMVYGALSGGEYDVEIKYTVSDSVGTAVACPNNNKFQKSIKFNTEKTRIFSSISRSLTVFGISLSVDASIKYITEAGKKDKAILNMKQVTSGSGVDENSTTRFTFEECNTETGANTNNCVTLSYSNIYDNPDDTKTTTLVKGRTNDVGGYVLTEYIDNSNEYEYYIEETFDANGDTEYFAVDYYDIADNNNDEYEELGFLDTDKYAELYDTNFDFEWDVLVDLNPAPVAVNPGGHIGNGAGFTTYDAYVVMPAGVNPNSFPDEFIGWGEFFNNESGGGNPVYYIDFYGEASQVGTAVIWRYALDNDGNEVYTQLSNTITQI